MAFIGYTDTDSLKAHVMSDRQWWTKGTYNDCILGNNANIDRPWVGSVLPNCTGYAYGRFSEILQKNAKLPISDAGTWYNNVKGYEKGSVPKIGAVAVWTKPGAAGHVAIVEKINVDGTIVLSESGWSASKICWTSVQQPPNYYKAPYQLQGFIYNPHVNLNNKVYDFLQEASKHIGEDGTWTWRTTGMITGASWAAAFILAVGRTVGDVIDNVIYNSSGAGEMARGGVANKLGSWIKGPHHGASHVVTPNPGDLILYRWKPAMSYTQVDDYVSDHIGIVYQVQNQIVYTIEGNNGGICKLASHSISDTTINGYYRPYWEKIGGSASGYGSDGLEMQVSLAYRTFTSDDMTLREVGYLTTNAQPSIHSTGIRLAVINYTDALASLINAYGQTIAGGNIVVDGGAEAVNINLLTNNNAKIIGQFLLGKGLNISQVVGFLANIQAESGYSPSAVNSSSGASGICQWLGSRKTAMIKACGVDWRLNLSGQLDFIWTELNSSEKNTWNLLQSKITSISQSAAEDATEIVTRYYERPGSYDRTVPPRRAIAGDIWKQILVVN